MWVISYPLGLIRDVVLIEGGRMGQREVGVVFEMPRSRGSRLVRSLGADPHQEGSVRREERRGGPPPAGGVFGGLIPHNVGIVVGLGVVVDQMAILVERVAEVVAGQSVPFVPPGRYVGLVVAVEILTEEGRPVALLLHPGGHRRVLVA